MAAGVPMTMLAADGAPPPQEQGQLPESSGADGHRAVDMAVEQPPWAVGAQDRQTEGILSDEERAGLCLLDLRASGSAIESDPMCGVEGPAAQETENVDGGDLAMPDAVQIRIAVGEQPWDSPLSTTTPANGRLTETKYKPNSFLKDVRGLLSTGLLEGFNVTYKKNKAEMRGRIKGQGYSCGCSECRYSNIRNACEFEQHSGESSNNQNDHIFLDTGISLYKVIQALKFTRLHLLGDLIEEHIGTKPNLVEYEKWKASFQLGKNDLNAVASNPGSTQSSLQESAAGKISHIALASLKEHTGNDSSNMNWSASRRRSGRLFKRGGTETSTPILSRSPEKGTFSLSTGTSVKSGTEETPSENTADPPSTDIMKPNSVGPVATVSTSTECDPINLGHLLSNPDTIIQELPPDHNVNSKSTESGQPKTRDNTLHPLLFKEGGLPDHALLTYKLKDGKVLKQGYKRGTGIVCDCCNGEFTPSQFEDHAGMGRRRQPYRSIYTSEGLTLHGLALKLQDSLNSNGVASANITTIHEPPNLTLCSGKQSCTTNEPIIVPLKRTLQERMIEVESCYLCGDSHTAIGIVSEHMMVFCNQCERACHVKCYNKRLDKHKKPLKVLEAYTQFRFFCCEKCKSLRTTLHEGLKNLEEIASFRETRSSICWQLLSARYPKRDLQESMHHQVIDIFKDAFSETDAVDSDVIQDMVNCKDTEGEKDFRGMYCAVLTTSNALVVSAAILKVQAEEVAELVLVATRNEFRKRGYFVLLLSLVEEHLKAWNVRLLTAPIDPEMASIWSDKLGFTILSEEEKKSMLVEHPLVMFKNLRLAKKSLA